ncbi:MAG: aldehyde dehydrogenase family protein [Phycisphaerae bacterium]|nr:aldehyde dehydrogenase family protein [Phycisphaerae bacterium]
MKSITQDIPAIPAFRFGKSYASLDQTEITTTDGQEVLATVGLVNPGIIRRDLRQMQASFDRLQQIPIQTLLGIFAEAAGLFLDAKLPVSEGVTQSSEQYVQSLSATCGMPHALIRANMQKIADVMQQMPVILKGLTRGLDLSAIETGMGRQNDVLVSYYANTTHLGLVLPSNSPGVNSLWLPAVALRIPVILKPGREDPWTPWRIINALIAAGCPEEAFGFYPAGHDGAGVILSECQRVIMFGDAKTVEKYTGDPRISVHGPGYSKVLIGEDCIDQWPDYADVLVDSIARNGGRSCVNASTIVVPRHGRALAEAIAERLAQILPLPLDDPKAQLAGFANAAMPEAIDARLEQALAVPGAEDVTAAWRKGPRHVTLDGQTYLHPTLIACSPAHSLAKTEYMFPFASVVELPQSDMLDWIGPSLVVTAITQDPQFRRALLRCEHIKRLNLGAMPTGQVSWDQPHEGNLFEFLYARRAIQEQVL